MDAPARADLPLVYRLLVRALSYALLCAAEDPPLGNFDEFAEITIFIFEKINGEFFICLPTGVKN